MAGASNFVKRTRYAMQTGLFDQRTDMIDDRSIFAIFFDSLPIIISGIFAFLGVLVLAFPSVSNFIFILGLPLFFYGISVQIDYLISAPYAKDKIKHTAKKKKKGKKYESENAKSGFRLKLGDAFMLIGYDMLFGRQLWISNDRETRMGLITGTTGSGKTVTLNSQLFQSCIQGYIKHGAPVLLADGKGSVNGLYDFLFYIVRTGRIHDVRLMNFLTGGAEHNSDSMLDEEYPSNKFNVLSQTNSEESRSLVMSFGRNSEGGSNDYFRDRASNMLAGVFPPLTWLRDNQSEHLDITVLQQNLGLREMIKLASRQDIPKAKTQALREYLKTLNMINDSYFTSPDADIEINQKADEQHTYNKSMVSKTVNEMAGTFGHIFSTVGSDINPRNAIMHGQILLVLLPTIEKEPDAMAELGRLFIGSLRPAFSSMFGHRVQGLRKDVVDGLAIRRIVPVRVFLDEVLNYYQKGLSQYLSLMRDRLVSLTLLGQSLKGMEDAGLSEARQSQANFNNWYLFSSQDVYETYDRISKALGTFRVKRLAEKTRDIWGNWVPGDRLQETEENVLNERDIAGAEPMEGVYLYRGNPIPFKSATFFADDERDGVLDRFYLNHFAELEPPTDAHIQYVRAILDLETAATDGTLASIKPEDSPNAVANHFVQNVEGICSRIEQKEQFELYRSFDVLVFAMVDTIVEMDIQKVNRTTKELQEEADLERQARLENRTIEEVLEDSNENSMIVDAQDAFASHSEYYSEQLGIGGYDIPDYVDDEAVSASSDHIDSQSDVAGGDRASEQEDDNDATSSLPSGTSWFDRAATGDLNQSAPSYGIVVSGADSDTSTDEKDSAAKKGADSNTASSSNSPLVNTETQKTVKDIEQVTSLSADEISRELLDVEIYPTKPTPPTLDSEEQSRLTTDVANEMSETADRYQTELDSQHASALDDFFGER
ncbi:type IV secretory system conjugative DNA transfer family protein [Vibrio coralliilyticus]|uniref:type IV secretory system conjugative DNA transfer family protein n=1 Tax=Vibrio coralliilyticus TaxID=190893 RepID=UPI001E512ED5|nr:helicase HerA-like domain-containing protein [Vibrio coralliilyticus]MCC2524971.1 DUF853 family protein [Vibrio coralliilyticus]